MQRPRRDRCARPDARTPLTDRPRSRKLRAPCSDPGIPVHRARAVPTDRAPAAARPAPFGIAGADRAADAALCVTGLLFSRMRWRSTDVRLVVGVPGLCMLALLGTISDHGRLPQPQRHLHLPGRGDPDPDRGGTDPAPGTRHGGRRTDGAGDARRGRDAQRSARRPDRCVHELCRVGSRRRDRRPGTTPVPLGLERPVATCLRDPADLRHRDPRNRG